MRTIDPALVAARLEQQLAELAAIEPGLRDAVSLALERPDAAHWSGPAADAHAAASRALAAAITAAADEVQRARRLTRAALAELRTGPAS